MKHKLLGLTLSTLLLTSCASPEKLFFKGEYDEAINLATKKYNKKSGDIKTKDFNALKQAFELANKNDLDDIKRLKASNDVEKDAKIHALYKNIKNRHQTARSVYSDPRNDFETIDNINTLEAESRDAAAEYHYTKASALLEQGRAGNKEAAQAAFTEFQKIQPYHVFYKDKVNKTKEAYYYGSTKVVLDAENRSNVQLPVGYMDDLKKLYLEDLNQQWVIFDSDPTQEEINNADFLVKTEINNIYIGPEEITETRYQDQNTIQEQQVVTDSRGNPVLDANGNQQVQVVNSTVTAIVYQKEYSKESVISGNMFIINAKTNQTVQTVPLEYGAKYQNYTAQFTGDQNALSQESIQKIQNEQTAFPTDQEIFDFTFGNMKEVIRQNLAENFGYFQS